MNAALARYVARRVGLAAVVLWAAFTVSFVVLYLLPGDRVETMAGGGLTGEPLPPEQLDALRSRYGLDQPLLVQYGMRLWAAVHGDFGTSIQTGQRVGEAIADALPSTALLAATALQSDVAPALRAAIPSRPLAAPIPQDTDDARPQDRGAVAAAS